MVSDLNLSNSGNNTDHQEPVRIIHNHNINPQAIRDLIKGALEPLPTDPVQTHIVISNISITKTPVGSLGLSCEVAFETTEGV